MRLKLTVKNKPKWPWVPDRHTNTSWIWFNIINSLGCGFVIAISDDWLLSGIMAFSWFMGFLLSVAED